MSAIEFTGRRLRNPAEVSAAYFSRARGLRDGQRAYRYAANVIGQPPGSPIYFAVDFDPSPSEISGVVNDYFQGVMSAFSAAGFAYPIGVHGSGCACSWLVENTDYVTFAWLAQAEGWCGFDTFTAWNIKQTGGSTVCGLSVDLDESSGDGGGFRLP